MRIQTLLAVAVAAAFGCAPQKSPPAASETAALTTDEQKTFYLLGHKTGEQMGVFSMTPAEQAIVIRGMTDGLDGKKEPFENPQAFGPKIGELARTRMQARSAGEITKGKEFAEKAAQEPGAEKTASGLVYKELTPGTGASPATTDQVKVNYRGTLINGTEFDSSYARNQPASFPLNGVISCWTEGVQKMKVGGKARLVCPSSIAYGERGSPPKIPAGATLVFEVELLEVVKKAEPPPQAAPSAPPAGPAKIEGAKPGAAKPEAAKLGAKPEAAKSVEKGAQIKK
jgi:FKBP-type peptidyl-prolyl cis-trans isomerase FkpA